MIFNLFKAKPTLKDLIPNGFVDIHSHILPGIDDGAKNIMESKKLISGMKQMGFEKIIGTPHIYPGLYNNNYKTIKTAFDKVAKNINEKIQIDFAAEIMLEESVMKKAQQKKLVCIKDNFVLVEMSYISKPIKLYEIIFEIKINGYIPILAHPERYTFLHNDFNELIRLKKVGCLFQANLLSLTNHYGKKVAEMLSKLIKNNMIDYFGSDIHSVKHILSFSKKVLNKDIRLIEEIMKKNSYFK